MLRIIALICLVFSLSLVTFGFYVKSMWQQTVTLPEQEYQVTEGWSYYRLVNDLHDKGYLPAVLPYKFLVWLEPDLAKVKAGYYLLSGEYTAKSLLEHIVKGKQAEYKITFVEGSRWRDWFEQLQRHPNIKKTLNQLDDQRLNELTQGKAIEGMLFPDTYVFFNQTTDLAIIKQAYYRMQENLSKYTEFKQSQQLDEYEILILASIIEKETSVLAEMPVISSVFYNRLRDKMRLQTDPTVIYGLGDDFKGDITRAHLAQKTAYNTYKINGLPPTPIAMPSLAAIQAAIYPAQTDYYYFVASGHGGHVFSKTLRQHNKAVKAYLKLSRERQN